MEMEELYKTILKMDSLPELRGLNRVVCDRISVVRLTKGAVVKAMCKVGDMVEFDSRKRGETLQGMVVKKKVSRAVVAVEGVRWDVGFSQLRKIDNP